MRANFHVLLTVIFYSRSRTEGERMNASRGQPVSRKLESRPSSSSPHDS